MVVRAALTLIVTGLLALHAVRTAAVRDDAAGFGRQIWAGHPQVELWQLMTQIGARARLGQSLTPEMVRQAEEIARKAPLASEPLLIKGALAQLDAREQQAERLFAEAARRDPRSEAARYFLAERFLRTGRIGEALVEMAALSRLIPGASTQFAPSLAQFAQTPRGRDALKGFLRSSPEFETPVLLELAKSADNADVILALWTGSPSRSQPDWRERLLSALVKQGQFARAYAVWRRLSGAGEPAGTLFNSAFQEVPAPPPFNWRYATQGGVAEPTGDGGLEVVYFGREDSVLAEQLLLIAPGRFQLGMVVSGAPSEGAPLRWKIDCLPGNQQIAELPMQPAQSPASAAVRFTVPNRCQAQRLRLVGEPPEFPRSVEIEIRQLRLQKVSGQ